jgi:hypothetical protein
VKSAGTGSDEDVSQMKTPSSKRSQDHGRGMELSDSKGGIGWKFANQGIHPSLSAIIQYRPTVCR